MTEDDGNYAQTCCGGLMVSGKNAKVVVSDSRIEGNDAGEFCGCQGGIGLADGALEFF